MKIIKNSNVNVSIVFYFLLLVLLSVRDTVKNHTKIIKYLHSKKKYINFVKPKQSNKKLGLVFIISWM